MPCPAQKVCQSVPFVQCRRRPLRLAAKCPAAVRRGLHQQFVDNGTFTEIQIEGVKRSYAVLTEDLPELLNCLELETPRGIHFISPLDSLLWYRERIVDVYDFYYRWEIYTPKEKRTYGAYVMPILMDGNLVGRMDPLFDRKKRHPEYSINFP